MDWMDFNRDGEVDAAEEYLGLEMMSSSREEHEALFGDTGDFSDDETDDIDDELDKEEYVEKMISEKEYVFSAMQRLPLPQWAPRDLRRRPPTE